jgi:hypothetical protein
MVDDREVFLRKIRYRKPGYRISNNYQEIGGLIVVRSREPLSGFGLNE